jgi:putative transposase
LDLGFLNQALPGSDCVGEALRILVNEASRIERAQHLQTMRYERSAQCVDQANGYKPKTMLTRMGGDHL